MATSRSAGGTSFTGRPPMKRRPWSGVSRPGQQAEQRGLPAAGRSEQDQALAGRDLEVDARARPGRAEALAHLLEPHAHGVAGLRGVPIYSRRPSMTTHLLALLLSVVALRRPCARRPWTLPTARGGRGHARGVLSRLLLGQHGREGAVLVLEVDGRYSQHLALARGERPAEYSVFAWPASRGQSSFARHAGRALALERRGRGHRRVGHVPYRGPEDADHAALAHAPFIYARPGTLEGKSDMPLVTWYETEQTPRRPAASATRSCSGTRTAARLSTG